MTAQRAGVVFTILAVAYSACEPDAVGRGSTGAGAGGASGSVADDGDLTDGNEPAAGEGGGTGAAGAVADAGATSADAGGADATDASAADGGSGDGPDSGVDLGPCGNGVTDGTETGMDCGGAECPSCPDGERCLLSSDCSTFSCLQGVCGGDQCPNDPNKIAPGACGCGVVDNEDDLDGDGRLACEEECDNDPLKASAGQCGCGEADTDTDSDGTADCVDGCPMDPLKTAAGGCGCGVSDADADGDGTADCVDECPADASHALRGDCGCPAAPDSAATACADGACPSSSQCDGAGNCGSEADCNTTFCDVNVVGGAGDGSSWENAYSSLSSAISATVSGNKVWVKEGIFTSTTYSLKAGVEIYGGFAAELTGTAGIITARDFANDTTIIDGGGSSRCLNGADNGHIDGFTIRNGYSTGQGAGIDLSGDSNVTIANCILEGHSSTTLGGAITTTGGSDNLLITDCVFRNNTADRSAAVHIEGSTIVRRSVFDNNDGTTTAYGGGVSTIKAASTWEDCLFINNDHPDEGGALFVWSGSATITNSTFYNNSGNTSGFAVWRNGGSLTITNSVFRGNATGAVRDTTNVTVNYSNVEGWSGGGTGNIDTDPLFVTGPGGDYYLSAIAAGQGADSACIDAGSDSAANLGLNSRTTRTDGVTDTGTVDMGYHRAP